MKLDLDYTEFTDAFYALETQERELKNARRLVCVLIEAIGGTVTIPRHVLVSLDDFEMTQSDDFENNSLTFSVKRLYKR